MTEMFDQSPPGLPKDLGPLVGALDQGTSSTRFLVFVANTGELVTFHSVPVCTISIQNSWAEADPLQLLSTSVDTIDATINNLRSLDIDPADVVSIGITNQRETLISWSKSTGKPFHNAILWHDTRTSAIVSRLKKKTGRTSVIHSTGLPLSTYFTSTKIKWLFDNVPTVSQALEQNDLMIGTVDTWLLWNLTGGPNGGIYVTDVTNASRTQLMDLESLEWDPNLLKFFELPFHTNILPKIVSSCEIYGKLTTSAIKGTPISGCIGDQQAALVGQNCLRPGQAKVTYGTGCFMLYNVGPRIVRSQNGLLSTIAYKMGPSDPVIYALEGSVAMAGGVVKFLQDQLNIFDRPKDIETLASKVEDSGDVYFVPAFSGLFAPYWKSDARGLIVGLTQFTSKEHLCRAALDAVSFQTREILESMEADSKYELTSLLVDGAMSQNNLLMQIQSDHLGIPVLRPSMLETTALGAAIIACQAEGIDLWDHRMLDKSATSQHSSSLDKFFPRLSENERNMNFTRWKDAVHRSFGWSKSKNVIRSMTHSERIYASVPGAVFITSSFLLCKIAASLAKQND